MPRTALCAAALLLLALAATPARSGPVGVVQADGDPNAPVVLVSAAQGDAAPQAEIRHVAVPPPERDGAGRPRFDRLVREVAGDFSPGARFRFDASDVRPPLLLERRTGGPWDPGSSYLTERP